MSRLSNACHFNQRDKDNNKEADNDNGAHLEDNSPTAATEVSFAILQLLFSWLHSTANNNEDDYDEKGNTSLLLVTRVLNLATMM